MSFCERLQGLRAMRSFGGNPRWCLSAIVAMLIPAAVAVGQPSPADWIPASAVTYLAAEDVQAVSARWKSTQLGLLWNHAAMQPFRDHLREVRSRQGSDTASWYGLTWDDLNNVADGAAALAVAPSGSDAMGSVLVVEVGQRREAARTALDNLVSKLEQAGAEKRSEQLQGHPVTALTLASEDDQTPATRRYCFLDDQVLIIADQKPLIEQVLSLRKGSSQESLARDTGFQAVRARVSSAMEDRAIDLTWYINPIQYMDLLVTAGVAEPDEDWQLLKPLGYEVFEAVGGGLCLTGQTRELESFTAIYAPGELQKAAQWFSLKPLADIQLPGWIPADVATVTQWSWDHLAAFSAYGYWFDHKFAEGEEGVFDDVLVDILEEPDGPRVDVRKELIDQLTSPTTMATFSRAAGIVVDTRMFALPISDAAAVSGAVKRMLEGDPDVLPQSIGQETAWVFRDLSREDDQADNTETASMLGPDLSRVAIIVAQQSLITASDADVLHQVVGNTLPPASQLKEFVRVKNEIQQRAQDRMVGWRFSQPRRGWRAWYESMRAGNPPAANSVPGMLLNLIFPTTSTASDGSSDSSGMDYTLLPEFSVVEQFLLPMGFWAEATEDGWLIVGFAHKPTTSTSGSSP